MKKRNDKGAYDDCPVCHGSGWDGEGYTLCCRGCSPSIGDMFVDERCDRKRDENGQLLNKSGEVAS